MLSGRLIANWAGARKCGSMHEVNIFIWKSVGIYTNFNDDKNCSMWKGYRGRVHEGYREEQSDTLNPKWNESFDAFLFGKKEKQWLKLFIFKIMSLLRILQSAYAIAI